MATHSSVLAWRIPGMGEPGGLRLWGRTESDTTKSDLAAAAAAFYETYSQFLLFMIVIFCKVIANIELMNTEPLLLGEVQAWVPMNFWSQNCHHMNNT